MLDGIKLYASCGNVMKTGFPPSSTPQVRFSLSTASGHTYFLATRIFSKLEDP
jgi:hypothetical protein